MLLKAITSYAISAKYSKRSRVWFGHRCTRGMVLVSWDREDGWLNKHYKSILKSLSFNNTDPAIISPLLHVQYLHVDDRFWLWRHLLLQWDHHQVICVIEVQHATPGSSMGQLYVNTQSRQITLQITVAPTTVFYMLIGLYDWCKRHH